MFPLGGINRANLYRQQPPYTTYDALNVMPKGPVEKRRRGGSRPGLALAYSDDLGSNVRMLTSMVVAPGIEADVGLSLSSLYPADNATGVNISTNLILTFSKSVQEGTGNITIYKSSDDSTVEEIDITGELVSFSSTQVTVNPTDDLDGYTSYYIKLDSGAIEDSIENTYVISDSTTWNFTTEFLYDTSSYLDEVYDGSDALTKGAILATTQDIIYGPPHGNSGAQYHQVFRLDPSDDTITHIGDGYPTYDNYGWDGAALDTVNDIIYCAPFNDTAILKIDLSDDSTNEFGNIAGAGKWSGAVYTNGYVYCIPYNYDSILKIDTSDDSTTTIATGESGSWKWSYGALADNGCIYCAPHNIQKVLKIDTSDDSVSELGSGLSQYTGPVFDSDSGCIYCAPTNASNVLKIDTLDDSVSTIGTIAVETGYYGPGAIGNDGCIYWAPGDGSAFLKVDPSDDSVSTFGTVNPPGAPDSVRYYGCVRSNNGTIYALPYHSTRIVKLT